MPPYAVAHGEPLDFHEAPAKSLYPEDVFYPERERRVLKRASASGIPPISLEGIAREAREQLGDSHLTLPNRAL